MVEKEKLSSRKIIHINLSYDFDLYGKPDVVVVNKIKERFKCNVLLISVCRLTAFKRPELCIQVVTKLLEQNVDVKLMMLGIGEESNYLTKTVIELGLEKNIFLLGYVNNVIDYMAAADLLIHPSLLDSSCVAVKEAGLVNLPVIACDGIGDFNDYVIHAVNGFLVSQNSFVEETTQIIVENHQDTERLNTIGRNLNESVLELFSVQRNLKSYDELNVE